MDGQLTVFDLLQEEEEPQSKPEPPKPKASEPMPQTFADYMGKCQFCYWYGYGMGKNSRFGEMTEETPCEWATPKIHVHECRNHNKWMPHDYEVMGLCANCEYGNLFHETDENGKPLMDKERYCCHPDGPLNRIELYPESREHGDGWHRNHEFDHCDRWRRDNYHYRKEDDKK